VSADETVEWLPESMMPVPQLDELKTWVMEGRVSKFNPSRTALPIFFTFVALFMSSDFYSTMKL